MECPGIIKIGMSTGGIIVLPITGLGLGVLGRALHQPRNIKKTDEEEITKAYKLWQKAPVSGLLMGSTLALVAASRTPLGKYIIKNRVLVKNTLGNAIKKILKPKIKISELKKNVTLQPHQKNVVEFIKKNKGKGIIAHATGLGKTLSSIAAFEDLKRGGKANKSIVIVPASLRDNFIKNLNEFTDSNYSIYGPKHEKASKDLDESSESDYNIISYEMFKKDPDGIIERTGADTIIVDEIHRSKSEETGTYKALSEATAKVKNVITLTGSLVSNEPADISPLIDITYGKSDNIVGNKKLFDKLFVSRTEKVHGVFNPVIETHSKIINKPRLKELLKNKIHYIPHEDVEDKLPKKIEEIIKIPMTPQQEKLYNYSLSALDPITRMKIRANIPVSQREMTGLMTKLIMGRKVMTDPGLVYDPYVGKDPYEYSPKIKKVIDDLEEHLDEDTKNKIVVYGNLLQAQINPMRKVLENKDVPYSLFIGMGNKGVTSKKRENSLKEFIEGKNRVLLISGAGGEGLDIKNATMMQMLEGHYNPEKIQQAEARIRRFGDVSGRPKIIKKYISYIESKGLRKKLGIKPPTSIDEYIYTVAKRKDKLNKEFKDVLEKGAELDDEAPMTVPSMIGSSAGAKVVSLLRKRRVLGVDAGIKQQLHNIGKSEFAVKRHLGKIKNISGIDERKLEIGLAAAILGATAPYHMKDIIKMISKKRMPMWANILTPFVASAGAVIAATHAPYKLLDKKIKGTDIIERAVDKYEEDLRKKVQRKLKSSKQYIDEHGRIKALGIDELFMER